MPPQLPDDPQKQTPKDVNAFRPSSGSFKPNLVGWTLFISTFSLDNISLLQTKLGNCTKHMQPRHVNFLIS